MTELLYIYLFMTSTKVNFVSLEFLKMIIDNIKNFYVIKS